MSEHIKPCRHCKGDGFVHTPQGWPCNCREAMCPHASIFDRDPTEPEQGVYWKYWIRRTDGSSRKGGKHENCEYFVLDWDHDPFAVPAALAYAAACESKNPQLAAELRSRAARATPPTSETKER